MPQRRNRLRHRGLRRKPLLQLVERGEIDPTRIITHTLPLEEAPHGFDIFKHKQDNCEKIVLKP